MRWAIMLLAGCEINERGRYDGDHETHWQDRDHDQRRDWDHGGDEHHDRDNDRDRH